MEKKVVAIIVVLVLVVAALATGLVIMSNSGKGSPSEVRVGFITGDIHHLPFAIADNATVGGGQSFYETNGLNVTPKGYANGGAIMDTGFGTNQTDIAYLGAAPAISKHLNLGRNIVNTSIIAQTNEEGSILVADMTVNSASDLVGKKVASPAKSSIQYLMLLKYLEDNGLNISGDPVPYNGTVAYKGAVNYTDAGAGTGKTLMQKPVNSIDHISAFIIWEPYGSDAVAGKVGHVLSTSHDIWPDHPCCVIVVNNQFAAAHPDIVNKFIAAHKQAINWINGAEASSTSADYALLVTTAKSFTEKNDTVVEAALSYVKYDYAMPASFKTMLEEFAQKMIDFGLIPSSKLTYNGNDYMSVQDFIARYVKSDYL